MSRKSERVVLKNQGTVSNKYGGMNELEVKVKSPEIKLRGPATSINRDSADLTDIYTSEADHAVQVEIEIGHRVIEPPADLTKHITGTVMKEPLSIANVYPANEETTIKVEIEQEELIQSYRNDAVVNIKKEPLEFEEVYPQNGGMIIKIEPLDVQSPYDSDGMGWHDIERINSSPSDYKCILKKEKKVEMEIEQTVMRLPDFVSNRHAKHEVCDDNEAGPSYTMDSTNCTDETNAKMNRVCKQSAHICQQSTITDVSRVNFKIRDNMLLPTNVCASSFMCEVCNKTFIQHITLKEHMKTHTSKGKHSCEVCNKCFRSIDDLNLHFKVHTKKSKRPFNCDICFKGFTRLSILNHHKENRLCEKVYTCKVCAGSFPQRNDLFAHRKAHTGEYACEVCNKIFTRCISLIGHLRIHRGIRHYTCKVCNTKFTRKQQLEKHMVTHTDEKLPYSCEVCKKGFMYCRSLRLHSVTHTNERPYNCQVCDKWFKRPEALKKHMKFHTGERVYTCGICVKHFKKREYLDNHMKRHTEERPYKCGICNNGFTQRSCLNVHMRTHTGERPFHCGICDKSFTRRSTLQYHYKAHTSE